MNLIPVILIVFITAQVETLPEIEITHVEKNEKAPISGILMSEKRFTAYMDNQLNCDVLLAESKAKDRIIANVAQENAILRQSNQAWIAQNGWWVGLIAGSILTSGMLYGAHSVGWIH